jgi:hypothetical protein
MVLWTNIAQWAVRLTGVTQVVLGLLFWTNRAFGLVTLHMAIGMVFVTGLWVLSGLAARAGLQPLIVAGTVAWGVVVPVFGMLQGRLLPGPMHWVIEGLHLVIGVVAMGLAARLASFIRCRLRARAADPIREKLAA